MTAETGDASPQLRRFAIYLQTKDLEETYEMDSFTMNVDTDPAL
jgi:hypothetical protein